MTTPVEHPPTLADDVHHLLNWLAIALFGATVYYVIHSVTDLVHHHWGDAALEGAVAVAFALSFYDTIKRSTRYPPRGHR